MIIEEFKNYIKEEYKDSEGKLIKPYYEIDPVNWSRLKVPKQYLQVGMNSPCVDLNALDSSSIR